MTLIPCPICREPFNPRKTSNGNRCMPRTYCSTECYHKSAKKRRQRTCQCGTVYTSGSPLCPQCRQSRQPSISPAKRFEYLPHASSQLPAHFAQCEFEVMDRLWTGAADEAWGHGDRYTMLETLTTVRERYRAEIARLKGRDSDK